MKRSYHSLLFKEIALIWLAVSVSIASESTVSAAARAAAASPTAFVLPSVINRVRKKRKNHTCSCSHTENDPIPRDSLSNPSTPSSSSIPNSSSANDKTKNARDHHQEERFIKPWPKPIIESNGDYRNEMFLEQHIGGPLYSLQNDLPRLPVPSIDKTIKLFLPTALPLAESDEEEESLLKACEDFPKEAVELQKRLEERAEEYKDSSWLQVWWNQSYLKLRDSIVINISYFFPLKDDETLQQISTTTEMEQKENDSKTNKKSITPMIARAACALTAIARYRKDICSGYLAPERIGGKQIPLCSSSFKYHLHSCRIPRKDMDLFRLYDPSLHRHCVVACRGMFFAMDFVDGDDEALPLDVLERGLEHCVDLAKRKEAEEVDLGTRTSGQRTSMRQFGFFTAGERDSWAKNRDLMISIGGKQMEYELERIESSALLICLDDENFPDTLDDCTPSYFYGESSSAAMNRWFDKPVQILVQGNGKTAYMGEHSMLDGMPAMDLCNRIVKSEYGPLKEYQSLQSSSREYTEKEIPKIEHIFEGIVDIVEESDDLKNALLEAQTEYKQNLNQDMTIKIYHGYGSKYMKQNSFSTDAFVQMAMQLASYRLFGQQVATYESCQTRFFLHGRTETGRSVSQRSNQFVKAMGQSELDSNGEYHPDIFTMEEKATLLKSAIWTHNKYLNNASKGLGCDRHFLGLSMVRQEDEKIPSLLQHPLFLRSKNWRLSTSTLPHVPGFGCTVDDGVGIGYNIEPEYIEFVVSARKGNQLTVSLANLLEEALDEMRMVVDFGKQM